MDAAKAFGPNLSRLAHLKSRLDPGNILAHVCPLPVAMQPPRIIILVTRDSCAGQDLCAEIWRRMLTSGNDRQSRVCTVSISDLTKQKYPAVAGADLELLLCVIEHTRNSTDRH